MTVGPALLGAIGVCDECADFYGFNVQAPSMTRGCNTCDAYDPDCIRCEFFSVFSNDVPP